MHWILVNAIYLVRWAWGYDLNCIELGGVVIAALAVAAGLRLEAAERWASILARRKTAAIAFVGILTLGVRAALLPVIPIPQPLVTDEFSHLLLADTLASGRVVNTSHPMWKHFETIHVIQQPAYASMYFPAQGLILAMGKVIAGHPWWGVWFSTGVLCAVLCWMLQQWLPPGWALFGGLLAMLRFGLFSYWMNSYWGGTVPALGGALVIGAVARIRKRPTWANGLIFAGGASILLFSRPYEGFALCLVALCLCARQWHSGAAVSFVVFMALSGAALSYYCYRVTGSPTRLPYQVNQQTYGWPMTLLWYHPQSVVTPHKELQDYYNWELSEHVKAASLTTWPDATLEKFQFLWGFFIGPCLTLPFLFFHRVILDRRMRPLLIAGAAVLAAVLVEQTGYPHYVAPATGIFLVLLLQAMRHMRTVKFGRAFSQALPIVLVATLVVRTAAEPLHVRYTTLAHLLSWCCNEPVKMDRAAVEAKLEALPGRHLVIVRYGPNHSFAREWIYNAADIDASKVVWARDMGQQNAELEKYFPDRKVWTIEPRER